MFLFSIKVDGIELTQQLICRLIKNSYIVDGMINSLISFFDVLKN